MSETETMNSSAVIKNSVSSRNQYYCTEDEWREFTGFTNQGDFPSATVLRHLENATEQIKKDAFHMMRWELVVKDSSGRYFTQRRYWANRYGRDATAITINCGEVSKYDIEVYEVDSTSSVAAALAMQGTRRNRLIYKIPYSAITEIDSLNCFFELSDGYPTVATRQIYVTYWVVGKPLEELDYELKRACIESTTILALKQLKTRRMKKGTVTYTLGKQTITRDEASFDEMIKDHQKQYDNWINWFKPFVGRRMKVGRMETLDSRKFLNRH